MIAYRSDDVTPMLQEFWTEGHHRNAPATPVGIGVAVCFVCDDAIALWRQFKSRGAEAKRPFVGNGMWVTELVDPDGYHLLFESPTDAREKPFSRMTARLPTMTEESTEQVPAGSLVDAIKRRDESALRAIVEHDPAQAEARDEAGVSVLMLAHYHRVDDNAIRAARSSALDVFEAATLGDVARLRELLDSDPSLVHAWSQDKGTALHFACYFNQPNAALLLLERGSCTGAVSPTFGGVTPLHSAAAAGNNAAVRALLAAGADPNARQKGGFTAIHTAAFTGNNEMVDDLLEADADPALKTEQGHDAADYARAEGNEALAERLRKG